MDTAKILDKIKKLHLKAESCKEIGSDHEAAAFAEMVNRMLNEHRLSLTDIQFEEKRKSEPVEQHEITWDDVRVRNNRVRWIESLAKDVAVAHTCDILVLQGSSRIWVVGARSNREIAEYMIVTLVRLAEQIAEKEYVKYYYKCRDEGDVTRARGFKAAFLDGFVTRIGRRLDEEKRRMEGESSTALVRFNQEAADVKNFFAKFTKPAAALSRNRKSHDDGYRAGMQKADDMNLNANAVKTTERKLL